MDDVAEKTVPTGAEAGKVLGEVLRGDLKGRHTIDGIDFDFGPGGGGHVSARIGVGEGGGPPLAWIRIG